MAKNINEPVGRNIKMYLYNLKQNINGFFIV